MFFQKIVRRYDPGQLQLLKPDGIASPPGIDGLDPASAEDMVLHLVAHLSAFRDGLLLQLPVQLCGIPPALLPQLLGNPAYPDVILFPDFLQKPGNQLLHAVLGSTLGFHQEEIPLRPGDSYVTEPALLFQTQFFPLLQGLGGGKYSLRESQDEHHREFQPLGGMDGHQFHGVLLLIIFLAGLERNLAQEVLQAQVFTKLPLKFIGNTLELRQVVQTLLIPQLPDIAFVAGALGCPVDDFRNAFPVAAFLHIADELHKGARVAALKFSFLRMPRKSLKESGGLALALILQSRLMFPQLFQVFHLRPAESSARLVHNPPEGCVVPVGDQLQIGQHIQDLHSLVEADAAEDLIRNIFLHQLFFRYPGQKAGTVKDGEI